MAGVRCRRALAPSTTVVNNIIYVVDKSYRRYCSILCRLILTVKILKLYILLLYLLELVIPTDHTGGVIRLSSLFNIISRTGGQAVSISYSTTASALFNLSCLLITPTPIIYPLFTLSFFYPLSYLPIIIYPLFNQHFH